MQRHIVSFSSDHAVSALVYPIPDDEPPDDAALPAMIPAFSNIGGVVVPYAIHTLHLPQWPTANKTLNQPHRIDGFGHNHREQMFFRKFRM